MFSHLKYNCGDKNSGFLCVCFYLVTRAEMISVMSLFSLLSNSSIGPGRGSCWVKCSQRRICCRFCQIKSASFSHLGDKNKRFKYIWTLMRHIIKVSSVDTNKTKLTMIGGHPALPHEGPRFPPAAASSSTGWAPHRGWESAVSLTGPESWGVVLTSPTNTASHTCWDSYAFTLGVWLITTL